MGRARLTDRRGKKINKANHGVRPHQRRRTKMAKNQWK